MENRKPHVSVIIPAYNQAKYLGEAIQSVLSQTYLDYEIIVVDDGSTDNTPLVASQFGNNIRYIRQNNEGLGGARNTGIRNANGVYIALLDSDDLWLPDFLESMMQLAAQNDNASVLYCNIRYIDSEGYELPQVVEGKLVADDLMYETLVEANFIIPSSVVMLRSVVIAAGLFDQYTPAIHGCEDWDLWLRLATTCHFAGTKKVHVKYRLHGSSLSADASKMQRAARAVIEKNYGPEDEDRGKWPKIKLLAYGGLYRYYALTSVMRDNDWSSCKMYLIQALRVAPSLSLDISFFYNLAMGSQPLGYRGTNYRLELNSNATQILQMLSGVFKEPDFLHHKSIQRQTYGTAYFASGLIAYNTGQTSLCRKYLLKAIMNRPELCHNSLVVGDFIKSFFSRSMIRKIKTVHS